MVDIEDYRDTEVDGTFPDTPRQQKLGRTENLDVEQHEVLFLVVVVEPVRLTVVI